METAKVQKGSRAYQCSICGYFMILRLETPSTGFRLYARTSSRLDMRFAEPAGAVHKVGTKASQSGAQRQSR